MDIIGNIDSKYRFVILASKRAKQLLQGAKPKIKTKTKNLIRIAQAEVRSGLIDFELLPTQNDDIQEIDETMFVGEQIVEESGDTEDLPAKNVEEDEPDNADDEEEEEIEDDDSDKNDEGDLKDENDS